MIDEMGEPMSDRRRHRPATLRLDPDKSCDQWIRFDPVPCRIFEQDYLPTLAGLFAEKRRLQIERGE
jgi:hypothetical protein